MGTEMIRVTYFDFVTIKKLEIDRMAGEHASAVITGYISDENINNYKHLLLENNWITIYQVDENGREHNIMTGIIAGFAMQEHSHVTELTLDIKGGTFLMDCTEHFRSFQNKAMTCIDFFKWINDGYDLSDVMVEKEFASSTLDFLLQYCETDWEFIKRVSSRFGMAITPAITRGGVLYYVGKASGSRWELPLDTRYSIRQQIGEFMRLGANGQGSFREQDYMEYVISAKEYYELWDLLTFGRNGGYVYRIQSQLIRGELIHTYYLRSRNGMNVQRKFNDKQIGSSFMAMVEAVIQDKVQVRLHEDENTSQILETWFPYSTGYSSPDGPGWYCMPEIGDRVRLYIPDHREEHGYVISAVHMETGSERKNPDCKSWKTKYGKELRFTPDTLELTNNKGMSIKITDGTGIEIVSNKNITIQSGQNLTLSSEKSSLQIAGTESVDVRQGSAGLHIDQDVVFTGGKFRIQ